MNKYDNYEIGKKDVLNQLVFFIEKQIADIKKQNPLPNSNRQITNGGKLLAYHKVLDKLHTKLEKIDAINH